jgi:AAA15 family ATPase/GTPase
MSKSKGATDSTQSPPAITLLSVSGFKSIVGEQTIEVRPLTLLAGANSSGKSSMMQPLLLLKQTLETPFDPGPLLLNGPNVKFTSVDQFWPLSSGKRSAIEFSISIGLSQGPTFAVAFRRDRRSGNIELISNTYYFNSKSIRVSRSSSFEEVSGALSAESVAYKQLVESIRSEVDP